MRRPMSRADVAANRFWDQPPTGQASIRTLLGLTFETRCMIMSEMGRCCNLHYGVGLRKFPYPKAKPTGAVTGTGQLSVKRSHRQPLLLVSRQRNPGPLPVALPIEVTHQNFVMGNPKGFINFPRHPQPMQQHRKLTRYRHYRPLFGILPPSGSQGQTPTPQIAVRTKRPQDILTASDQKPPQKFVPCFGDPQLTIALARLVHTRSQAQIRPHRSALFEPMGVLKDQHIRKA